MDPFEQMKNDPVFKRDFEAITRDLAQAGARLTPDQGQAPPTAGSAGNSGSNGFATDALRARDITQDRPGAAPTYILPTTALTLGWHHDLTTAVRAARDPGAGAEQTAQATRETAGQEQPRPAPTPPRGPQGHER